jgi:hypothetical protein
LISVCEVGVVGEIPCCPVVDIIALLFIVGGMEVGKSRGICVEGNVVAV